MRGFTAFPEKVSGFGNTLSRVKVLRFVYFTIKYSGVSVIFSNQKERFEYLTIKSPLDDWTV